MGWTRHVRCKNVRCDLVSRTFVLIAKVRLVLHRVLCINEMITNAAKHYEMHKNMSLGSNGLDRVCSLRKISPQLHGTNFCTNCTSSASLHHVSSGNETIQNAPEQYETHQNMSLGSNGVYRVRSLRNIPSQFHGTNFALIAQVEPVCTIFRAVMNHSKMHPNTMKHTKT